MHYQGKFRLLENTCCSSNIAKIVGG